MRYVIVCAAFFLLGGCSGGAGSSFNAQNTRNSVQPAIVYAQIVECHKAKGCYPVRALP